MDNEKDTVVEPVTMDIMVSFDRIKNECVPVLSLLPSVDDVAQKDIIRNCTKGRSDISVGPFDLYKIGSFNLDDLSIVSYDRNYLATLHKGDIIDDPELKCDKE